MQEQQRQQGRAPRTHLGQANRRQPREPHSRQEAFGIPFRVCPRLGSSEDPETARSYVTPENCCHHVRPATSVKEEHQRVYCLSSRFVKCPIFLHEAPIKLRPRRLQRFREKRYLFSTLFVCMLFILAAVILASVTW